MPVYYVLAAAMLLVVALTGAGSARLQLPQSIILVVVGAAISFVPGLPPLTIDPDVVLLLFLPPLLYSSGVGMSWRGFRANLRPILLLAIGCVLFTAAAVAAVGHALLALPWAIAVVLGAVVAPPDAVAPMAIMRRLTVPARVVLILEGEGLVNDATALILFAFAVAAVTAGGVSMGAAVGTFVAIVAGEILWGVAVGWTVLRLRRWAKNPEVEIILALLSPYLAFWVPHALGGSGVLAAVAAGLFVSWNGPRFIPPATRLQGFFVWGLIVHLLEALLFLLTGLQARVIVAALGGDWERPLLAAAAVSAMLVVVRFIWVFPATYLPRWLSPGIRKRDPAPHWSYPTVIGFTGIRGVVSLAAALSIPLTAGGAAFPDRDLILFVTFVVILVTLVGQGLTLPWLVARVGLVAAGRAEAARDKAHELAARIAGVEAALAALDTVATDAPAAAVVALRQRHRARLAEYQGAADTTVPRNPVTDDAEIQTGLIAAERERIAAVFCAGDLSDEARRRIERELDLEHARNLHAAESAAGDALADPANE